MIVSIIGGGFGLYGYLPAVMSTLPCGRVLIPKYFKRKFMLRKELQSMSSSILWTEGIMEAIFLSDISILAIPPKAQYLMLEKAMKRGKCPRFILEKPLAENPKKAIKLLCKLRENEIIFDVGTTFYLTKWKERSDLLIFSPGKGDVLLNWSFMAYHFAKSVDTWKRRHTEGGGILRFFGIHIIALLVEWGYGFVRWSCLSGLTRDEPDRWRACFFGEGLPNVYVNVNSRSNYNEFSIKINGGDLNNIFMESPFEQEDNIDVYDVRVGLNVKLFKNIISKELSNFSFHKKVVKLWGDVESISTIMNC